MKDSGAVLVYEDRGKRNWRPTADSSMREIGIFNLGSPRSGCKEVCVEELGGCGCQAACDGSHCGEDGCGGLCVCPEQHVCSGVTCVCVPDCPEGMCMADGCGGTCQCPASDTCVDGECKCFPDCDGKKCGDDGCGGSCGSCSDGQLCSFDGECGYCLAEGSGTTVGETASDTVWTDSEGETFHLHSQCKSKKAILLMETAGW